MKKLQLFMAAAVAAFALSMGGNAFAQPDPGGFGGGGPGGPGGGGPGGGFGGGGGGGGNFDPQQFQDMLTQRINDSYRQQMDVTNDDEWAIIQAKITAVTKARSALTSDGGGLMGMGALMRGGRGGGGGAGGGGGFQAMFGTPSPESDALQKAVDDNAPAAQIKELMTKFQAVHDAKQTTLTKAQEDLRSVLTTRQEAIALLGGLLN
jgi:Spy/CpxP family protein refolding chaperone